MKLSGLKNKVFDEIQLVPENKLKELYDFIHYFRLGIETSKEPSTEIMKFAGCWNDMPKELYDDLSGEFLSRRTGTSLRRQGYEKGID